ncbi:MAG: hypothetical protein ACQETZ_06400, partial [Candidatus Fermentibacterota bacterium]
MGWPVHRTIREISKTLEELKLADSEDSPQQGAARELPAFLRGDHSRLREILGNIPAAVAAALMVWDPFSLGQSGSGPFAVLLTSSLQGYRGRLDDPRFPSGRTLAEAGLSLKGSSVLALPAASALGPSAGTASQVLQGRRGNREVRSGAHVLPDGRVLLRTGISATPPCFSCEVVDGHLLSTSTPMSLDAEYLKGRTGPGRTIIVNDGRWLVIDRLLPASYHGRRAMLLLRQLRDVALAERLAA